MLVGTMEVEIPDALKIWLDRSHLTPEPNKNPILVLWDISAIPIPNPKHIPTKFISKNIYEVLQAKGFNGIVSMRIVAPASVFSQQFPLDHLLYTGMACTPLFGMNSEMELMRELEMFKIRNPKPCNIICIGVNFDIQIEVAAKLIELKAATNHIVAVCDSKFPVNDFANEAWVWSDFLQAETTKVEIPIPMILNSVWWDVDNCPIPKNITRVVNIHDMIRKLLVSVECHGDIQIYAKGVISQFSNITKLCVQGGGIDFKMVPNGKNSTDIELVNELMNWCIDNPPPANIILISDDCDYASMLHKLRFRGYTIMLLHRQRTSMLQCAASQEWIWPDVLNGYTTL